MSLSEKQRRILAAVSETILGVSSAAAATPEALADTRIRVEAMIASLGDAGDRARLAFLLSLLGSPIANLVLSGRFGSLDRLDASAREAVLSGWAHSRLALRRVGFQALKRLTNVAHYCWPESDGSHPMWRQVGYPGPLPATGSSIPPLPSHPIEGDTVLECDVVVVGSGAGGGVVAGVLASRGMNVVVLEKGRSLGSEDMTQIEGEMLGAAYLDGGLLMTRSGSLPILAGSCLGGGTVINYTTSLPLPERTREEWDRASGLSLFSSPRFSEALARVCAKLNVGTDHTTASARDQILERGLTELGWHVDKLPRNVTDCVEGLECGYCGYGCRHGAKNSTARTYLADAVAAGSRVVVDASAERVLRERGAATGVFARVQVGSSLYDLTVRAPRVVVACGSIHTPALLTRSGLENPNIGRGLRLHPASAVVGRFPDRVEPWSGALQTRYSDQFADLDDGYGVKFETAPVHFALPASAFGWETAARYREDIAQLAHTSIVGVLLRDRDAGRVATGRDGQPKVHYEISQYDAAHWHQGVSAAAQVLAAAGAEEVASLHSPPVRAHPRSAGWFEGFSDGCATRGYRHGRMSAITFHQMASAAMGSEPKRSVVAETGETYEVKGLYVADASTFPTSSGVNPMITIMAIADHVARGIADSR